MYGRKSSHEDEIGRHGISCYTESKASMARTRLVGAIGARGVISSGVEETIAGVSGCRMSSGNGGTLPKEPSKHHEENLP